MEKYTFKFEVPSYMSDIKYRLRAVSFMELAQDAAGKGADSMNFGDSNLTPLNAVWVLARMQLRFINTPHRYDNVEFQTWHRGLQGAQYLRDYQMVDGSGNVLVASSSSWLIMEKTQRRMLYGKILEDFIPSEPQCNEKSIEEPCPKIKVPSNVEMKQECVHLVCYSDVDYNIHANNTKYVQWAMDLLPTEYSVNGNLKELLINFNREAHLGERVKLFLGINPILYNGDCSETMPNEERTSTETECYVEGLSEEGQQVFICKLIFI